MRQPHLLLLLLISCLFSCKSLDKNTSEKETLFSIGESPVSTEEFVYVFNKNNQNDSVVTQQSIDEYLDLFIKFKLKIREARSRGLQNTEEFKNEFNVYRDELAKPYLTETKVVDELVNEAYERMKEEVNASHILVRLEEHAQPEDTLAAYRRIQEIREKAVSGDDFAKLAQMHSEDPSARMNNGRLGYFTALQMVYPFEENAYTTQPGEISPVFRTRFGYHILKVHDRRPSQGKIKTSHIMIRAAQGISAGDSIAARKKIHEIYDKLMAGELWFDLCTQFSEDLGSRSAGGALPWFGTGNMVPEFEQAAFALADTGDITKPVKTAYGWHIIRLDDRKGLEPLEEIKEDLTNRIKRDSRSELSEKALLERLKKENQFVEYAAAVNDLWTAADSSLLQGKWQAGTMQNRNTALFRMQDSVYVASDFFRYVEENQKAAPRHSPAGYLQELYESYKKDAIISFEKSRLAQKYYDYKMLVKEYEEGILLFQLMDTEVWSKAVNDTTGLRNFYETNKARYQWKERVDAAVFNANAKKIIEQVKPLLDQEYLDVNSSVHTLEFDADRGNLNNTHQEQLDAIAETMEKQPSWTARIAFNPASDKNQERVDHVTAYLQERLPAEQIKLAPGAQQKENAIAISFVSDSRKVIENRFNKTSALELHVEEGLYEKGDHELLNEINWLPGIYEITRDGRYYLIEVKNVMPPGYKKLDNIRGIVISDYQNFLEETWIDELEKEYPISINEKALRKIYKQLEAI